MKNSRFGAPLLAAAAALALPGLALAANPAVTVSVDAAAGRHAINPEIYGVAFADANGLQGLNATVNRSGGNATSRYNWQQNCNNHASDWFFESIAEASSTPGEVGDTFVTTTKNGGAVPMLTVPLMDWVSKVGPNRSKLASFSIQKYGPQQANDSQWFPDAGNGVHTNGSFVTGNDPNDANTPSNTTLQGAWIDHLVGKWGLASQGGVKYYLMDNEPGIWQETHRDVHPVGAHMEEVRDRILAYAARVKASDPTALVVGPEEWGWSGYLYDGYDLQWGNAHGWGGPLPDRTAHNGWYFLPWLLDQLRQNNASTSHRLLDVFSVHYYPQGGEFSNDTSTATELLRNRSTRSLWDPSYVDQSWINDKVYLIPRLKQWVNSYYPGTKTAVTEYNWGAEGSINGATAQADVWGIFGREGLDLATRWTTPDPSTPTYKAMQLYRNYDGSRSAFGDLSVTTTAPNPDNCAAFGAIRFKDGALTVMVVNKSLSGTTTLSMSLANFASGGPAKRYQLTSTNSITHLADLALNGANLSDTLPAPSVTLYVIPGLPQFAATGSASPATVTHGQSVSLTANVTCTSGSWSNGIVDAELYDAGGHKVAQSYWTGQSFTYGQAKKFTWTWTAPATAGNYTLKLGVFSSDWSQNPYWNNGGATIAVQ